MSDKKDTDVVDALSNWLRALRVGSERLFNEAMAEINTLKERIVQLEKYEGENDALKDRIRELESEMALKDIRIRNLHGEGRQYQGGDVAAAHFQLRGDTYYQVHRPDMNEKGVCILYHSRDWPFSEHDKDKK